MLKKTNNSFVAQRSYRTNRCIILAPVVQKVDNAIHWIAQLISLIICWTVICPVDSAIQRLNNPDQENKSTCTASYDSLSPCSFYFSTISVHTPTSSNRNVTLYFFIRPVNITTGNMFSRHQRKMGATSTFTLTRRYYKSTRCFKSKRIILLRLFCWLVIFYLIPRVYVTLTLLANRMACI